MQSTIKRNQKVYNIIHTRKLYKKKKIKQSEKLFAEMKAELKLIAD